MLQVTSVTVVTSAPLSVQPAKWQVTMVTKAMAAFGPAARGRASRPSNLTTVEPRRESLALVLGPEKLDATRAQNLR